MGTTYGRMRGMAGLSLNISRVEAMPYIGDATRSVLRASRVAMVRARPYAGPLAGLLASAEERLYQHEQSLAVPRTTRRVDLRQPLEMTDAQNAAIERAAKASRLNTAILNRDRERI
jgi:hypothetical protein